MKKKTLYASVLIAVSCTATAVALQQFPGGPWPGPEYYWYHGWGPDPAATGVPAGDGNGVVDQDWEDREGGNA